MKELLCWLLGTSPPKRKANRLSHRNSTRFLTLEPLEDRLALANLVWVNRGQDSDRFGEVFGANADAARAVVDAVLTSWATVLTNLNQPPVDAPADRNTINFTIGMDATRAGFGGGATATAWAFPTQADKDANRNGHPIAGTFTLDRGQAGEPNNGWFIDPTPNEHSEFTNVLTPFAAARPEGAPGTDMYSTINAEIAHILGLFDTAPSRFTTPVVGAITRTQLRDQAHGGGRGFYFVFDGPSGTHLLTSFDSGAGDVGAPTHSAGPTARNYPVPFTSQFRNPAALRLTGSLDAGNAAGDGARVLASDNIANLLKDAFGYEVRLPSTIPGQTYAVAVNGGELAVRGGPDGDGPAPAAAPGAAFAAREGGRGFDTLAPPFRDTSRLASSDLITLRRDGSELVVTVDFGRDGPVGGLDPDGDGNAPAFVTRVPLGSFTSIRLDADGGNDRVVFDFSGGDFLPDGGVVFDGDLGTDELTVIGAGAFQLDADSLNLTGIGQIDLTSVSNVALTGGAAIDTFTVRGWAGGLSLDGAGGSDVYDLDAAAAMNAQIVDASGLADRLVVSGTPNDDVISVASAKVKLGTTTIRYGSGIEELIIDGLAGNDRITVTSTSPGSLATLRGGPGNDVLTGSRGSEVIFGGEDNDTINGRGGNDLLLGEAGNDSLRGQGVLIGGLGADQVFGKGSVLIGGSTVYDGGPNLVAIRALWGRTDLTYDQRVDHLRLGGPDGLFPLSLAAIVDDVLEDRLVGGSGLDWFFVNPLDRESGRKRNEQLN